MKGHDLTVGERLEQARETMIKLPHIPYDASDKQAGRVRSLSLERYKSNDYLVPVVYGYRQVMIRGLRPSGGDKMWRKGRHSAPEVL